MIREEVHCIIGIIDTHDVIHSRIILENSDDEWTTHEDIWPTPSSYGDHYCLKDFPKNLNNPLTF